MSWAHVPRRKLGKSTPSALAFQPQPEPIPGQVAPSVLTAAPSTGEEWSREAASAPPSHCRPVVLQWFRDEGAKTQAIYLPEITQLLGQTPLHWGPQKASHLRCSISLPYGDSQGPPLPGSPRLVRRSGQCSWRRAAAAGTSGRWTAWGLRSPHPGPERAELSAQ